MLPELLPPCRPAAEGVPLGPGPSGPQQVSSQRPTTPLLATEGPRRPNMPGHAALCRKVAAARPTPSLRPSPLPAAAANGNGTSAPSAPVDPQLLELLQGVAAGVLTPSDASVQLSGLVSQAHGAPAEAAVGRAEFPEVVWGEHKSAGQLLAALHRIAERQGMAAATRVPAAVAAEVVAADSAVTYNDAAHMLVLKSATTKQAKLPGSVALICAGTADAGVVEECRVMLSAAGCYAFKLAESGVMGMHRCVQGGMAELGGQGENVPAQDGQALQQALHGGGLSPASAASSPPSAASSPNVYSMLLTIPTPTTTCRPAANHSRRIVQNLDAVKAADVVICITGMDGGLASVVAGMVEVPVIALPTSTGGPLAAPWPALRRLP